MCHVSSRFLVAMLTLSLALAAHGEFVQPTETQVAAAAGNPSANLTILLKDANTEQAAQVIKVVIVKVLGLDLPPDVRTARIAAVIRSAFSSVVPQAYVALSSSLGNAIAGSTAIIAIPGVVSTVQAAVAAAGGGEGAALAQVFGTAYLDAQQKLGGTSQKTKNDPPPLAMRYEGQLLP